MKPETEVLLAAACALTPREHWTAGVFARDANGRVVSVDAPEAAQFCARGAIRAAAGAMPWDPNPVAVAAEKAMLRVIGAVGIGEWNNEPKRTHGQVLAALYKAAEIAEQQRGR